LLAKRHREFLNRLKAVKRRFAGVPRSRACPTRNHRRSPTAWTWSSPWLPGGKSMREVDHDAQDPRWRASLESTARAATSSYVIPGCLTMSPLVICWPWPPRVPTATRWSRYNLIGRPAVVAVRDGTARLVLRGRRSTICWCWRWCRWRSRSEWRCSAWATSDARWCGSSRSAPDLAARLGAPLELRSNSLTVGFYVKYFGSWFMRMLLVQLVCWCSRDAGSAAIRREGISA
jgi:hypothetical protein